METRKGSNGGKATAIVSRQRALEKYYANPNICKYCGKVIEIIIRDGGVRVTETKLKQFCSHTCSQTHNNALRPKPQKAQKIRKINDYQWLLVLTKGQMKDKYKTYQSFRSIIQKHARKLHRLSGHTSCAVCQYTNHIEVAHIKSVSSFPDDTTISEINSLDNLIGLCPNHHWEYDNGILKIENIRLITTQGRSDG